MTDNEIIKALECCSTSSAVQCHDCPYCGNNYEKHCAFALANDAFDLINRQQAEIERKISLRQQWQEKCKELLAEKQYIKSQAIKELLDKIEKQAIPSEDDVYWVELDDIYNLVKEMVGDTE